MMDSFADSSPQVRNIPVPTENVLRGAVPFNNVSTFHTLTLLTMSASPASSSPSHLTHNRLASDIALLRASPTSIAALSSSQISNTSPNVNPTSLSHLETFASSRTIANGQPTPESASDEHAYALELSRAYVREMKGREVDDGELERLGQRVDVVRSTGEGVVAALAEVEWRR